MVKRKKGQKVCKNCGKQYLAGAVKSLKVIRRVKSFGSDYYDIRTVVVCPHCGTQRNMTITVSCVPDATDYELTEAIEKWFND